MQQAKKKASQRTRTKPIRPSSGRPTLEQAKQRHEELLEHALAIFLEHGFEQSTIEEIATAAGMSKRTVYSRYDDKAALFKATVQRAVERYTVPKHTLTALEAGDLEETLFRVARMRLDNLMTPNAIMLQRILSTQSYRFPELFQAAYEEGTGPTMDFLADLFKRHAAAGEIEAEDPKWMAAAFLSLAIGGPARLIISGNSMQKTEADRSIRAAVHLFLNGVQRTPGNGKKRKDNATKT